MGSASVKPKRLGEKLTFVRKRFGYSLAEMADKLSDDRVAIAKQDVHRYERGEMAPSIIVLLRYARLARVKMEVFADDELDLPAR